MLTCKRLHINDIFYKNVGACKQVQKNQISYFLILSYFFTCYIWMFALNKNAKKNICVAICFGLM